MQIIIKITTKHKYANKWQLKIQGKKETSMKGGICLTKICKSGLFARRKTFPNTIRMQNTTFFLRKNQGAAQNTAKVEAEKEGIVREQSQLKLSHIIGISLEGGRVAITVDFSIERQHKGGRMENGRQFPER